MKAIHLAAIAAFSIGSAAPAFAEKDAEGIASSFKGKIIALEDGEIVEAELKGDPEYFVLYHSASW